jgi:hypothetical protein
MKESDITKNIPSHRRHGHKITSSGGHSKGDHKHPSSESGNEIEEHEQHEERHQPKKRSTTMRGKIAASIIALLTIVGLNSTIDANAASIKDEKLTSIQANITGLDKLDVIDLDKLDVVGLDKLDAIGLDKILDLRRNVIAKSIENGDITAINEIAAITKASRINLDSISLDRLDNLSITDSSLIRDSEIMAISKINIETYDSLRNEILDV